MSPSFIAFLNKSGIVCAADTDHTIYQLSTEQPFAIAVNPSSRFPWRKVVQEYVIRTNGKPAAQEIFGLYVNDFEAFIMEMEVQDEWYSLSREEASVVFMGYGKDDLFPSVYEAEVRVMEGGFLMLYATDGDGRKIGKDCSVTFSLLGNFDSVRPLLYGFTDETHRAVYDSALRAYEAYRERILERFNGTRYEEYITGRLDEFDVDDAAIEGLRDAHAQVKDNLHTGVGTFSIEDLVSSVETIINANARLRYLREGSIGEQTTAKEIAVLTRHRGEELTWCKHSLYAL